MSTHITAPLMQDQTFEGYEWKLRRIFVTFINKAARELGIAVTWLSDHWVAKLEKDGQVRYIHGYTFPLNDSGAMEITRDKVSTYEVLDQADIPAVPHYLVRFTQSQLPLEAASKAIRFSHFPMVVKPLRGLGGHDLSRVYSIEELNLQLTELAGRYPAVAISPYLQIQKEYRVVMLDKEALIIFEKVISQEKRDAGHWQHNLRLDATPQVHSTPSICQPLIKLARQTMAALGARFLAIDIVQVDGQLMILELNSGSLNQFSQHSPMYALQAFAAYKAALDEVF